MRANINSKKIMSRAIAASVVRTANARQSTGSKNAVIMSQGKPYVIAMVEPQLDGSWIIKREKSTTTIALDNLRKAAKAAMLNTRKQFVK